MSTNRFSEMLPAGLVRDIGRGRIAGVCAGLGGYFGIKVKFVRLFFILMSAVGFFFLTVTAYVILAMLMPRAPGGFVYDGLDAASPAGPSGLNPNLREHFTKLDRRLATMEAWVTSDDYRLRQKFRDL